MGEATARETAMRFPRMDRGLGGKVSHLHQDEGSHCSQHESSEAQQENAAHGKQGGGQHHEKRDHGEEVIVAIPLRREQAYDHYEQHQMDGGVEESA